MTALEIESLLAKGENVRLEFKKSETGEIPKTIYNTVCSFLNREGGTILVGVDDSGNRRSRRYYQPFYLYIFYYGQ